MVATKNCGRLQRPFETVFPSSKRVSRDGSTSSAAASSPRANSLRIERDTAYSSARGAFAAARDGIAKQRRAVTLLGVFFPDLGTECEIASGPRIRAIGWLAADQPFTCGPLDAPAAAAIDRLAEDGWVHVAACGAHTCELCRVARDARNVLVPGIDSLYVAPAMVSHYMREHGYLPPAEFREAARRCPAPGSDAYFAELRRFLDAISSRFFCLSDADFDRIVREHREWLAARDAERERPAARRSRPRAASCRGRYVDESRGREPRRIAQALSYVVELQLREFAHDLAGRPTRRKVAEHRRDGNADPADTRLAAADARVGGDTRERSAHAVSVHRAGALRIWVERAWRDRPKQ